MYDNQSSFMNIRTPFGDEIRLTGKKRHNFQRKRKKNLETPRELMALVSYLRQQEAGLQDAMQLLQDVP